MGRTARVWLAVIASHVVLAAVIAPDAVPEESPLLSQESVAVQPGGATGALDAESWPSLSGAQPEESLLQAGMEPPEKLELAKQPEKLELAAPAEPAEKVALVEQPEKLELAAPAEKVELVEQPEKLELAAAEQTELASLEEPQQPPEVSLPVAASDQVSLVERPSDPEAFLLQPREAPVRPAGFARDSKEIEGARASLVEAKGRRKGHPYMDDNLAAIPLCTASEKADPEREKECQKREVAHAEAKKEKWNLLGFYFSTTEIVLMICLPTIMVFFLCLAGCGVLWSTTYETPKGKGGENKGGGKGQNPGQYQQEQYQQAQAQAQAQYQQAQYQQAQYQQYLQQQQQYQQYQQQQAGVTRLGD